MTFKIASSPHGHSHKSTSQLMLWVLLAALPGIACQWYFFGSGVLWQIIIACGACIATEALVMLLRQKPLARALGDYSALVTALLLAVSLPPSAPWWLTVLGCVFAIGIVKQLYGGMGFNLFNPAMAAYVFLLISFPVPMTSWLPAKPLMSEELSFFDPLYVIFSQFTEQGFSLAQLRSDIDGMTMATPLDSLKTDLHRGLTLTEALARPTFDSLGGIGWAWVNIAFAAGGALLLALRVIQWQIPVAMLASLFTLSGLFWLASPDTHVGPMLQLLSGATMLGAFFIATDPVSASTTTRGRLIYGAVIGALVFVIRSFGGYPDGVAFAVLLANLSVPLIDYYTRPRSYGHRVNKG